VVYNEEHDAADRPQVTAVLWRTSTERTWAAAIATGAAGGTLPPWAAHSATMTPVASGQ
jgi:hypothetical protein